MRLNNSQTAESTFQDREKLMLGAAWPDAGILSAHAFISVRTTSAKRAQNACGLLGRDIIDGVTNPVSKLTGSRCLVTRPRSRGLLNAKAALE
jgi:hypothetical protein